MHLADAIDDVYVVEDLMAEALSRTGARHAGDPEIYRTTHRLIDRGRAQLERLAPFGDRYGTPSPFASTPTVTAAPPNGPVPSPSTLLRDLIALYRQAHRAEIAWIVLQLGARAVHDGALADVVAGGQQDAQVRWQWLRTRIEDTAPRVLTPGYGSDRSAVGGTS